jgi:hypothetical protein
MATKLDFVVIATVVAGCALWLEQGHRVVIDPPTQSELAAAAAAEVCPDKDSVPASANCLAFLFGTNWQPTTAPAAPAPLEHAEVAQPSFVVPCPDRDDVPYSASCLAYLQGSTTAGMRWRVSAPPVQAPPPIAMASPAGRARESR